MKSYIAFLIVSDCEEYMIHFDNIVSVGFVSCLFVCFMFFLCVCVCLLVLCVLLFVCLFVFGRGSLMCVLLVVYGVFPL